MGDRFFLCDNKILCEYDYEERMVFANLAYNSNSLAQMKSQATRATALPPPPQPPLGSMAGPAGKVRIDCQICFSIRITSLWSGKVDIIKEH